MTDATNLPTWKSPAYAEMQERWQRCRDIRDATPTIRTRKEAYLPKFQAEDTRDWQTRVDMTVVMDFFEQAVTTLVGLGLRHDPELGEDVPEELVTDWENLDGEGNHGAVVAQAALDAMLTDGHVVLLTEAPPQRPENAKVQGALGIRPYVVLVKIDNIISWRTGIVGGERILLQAVFREVAEESSGLFGTTSLIRYRVYTQRFRELVDLEDPKVTAVDMTQPYVTWELWEQRIASGATPTADQLPTLRESGELAEQKRIPARVAYGGKREGILRSRPPLDGLAFSNIRWAQAMSDRTMSLHKCGMPIPVIIGKLVGGPEGLPSDNIVLSTSAGLQVEQGGDAKMVEAAGTALEQGRRELEDWEKRIGSQAISMLQRDTATAETATAHRLNKGREESKLSRALRSLEDALEGALQDMAVYRRLDPESIDVTIRRDFADVISNDVLTLLTQLEQNSQLTMTRLLKELQRAGLFSNDFNVDDEVEALKRQSGTSEGMGLGQQDPALMTDEQIQAELAAIEQEVAQRKAGKQPPAPGAVPPKAQAA